MGSLPNLWNELNTLVTAAISITLFVFLLLWLLLLLSHWYTLAFSWPTFQFLPVPMTEMFYWQRIARDDSSIWCAHAHYGNVHTLCNMRHISIFNIRNRSVRRSGGLLLYTVNNRMLHSAPNSAAPMKEHSQHPMITLDFQMKSNCFVVVVFFLSIINGNVVVVIITKCIWQSISQYELVIRILQCNRTWTSYCTKLHLCHAYVFWNWPFSWYR